jgi:polysaccharide biosynthesis transport protein
MSIVQFLRIFWARRWLIAATTATCIAGAVLVTLLLPPRWEAHSRIMLNLLKPDPVTGDVIAGPSAQAYVATQTELITDYSVAGQVVDQLGWLSDPQLIEAYQHRDPGDKRDFRRWLAQIIIDRTKAEVLAGGNILDITYRATNADDAKTIADALRKAYMDTSLVFRRDEAGRSADWFATQATAAKARLDAAEAAKNAYERANGIVMADDTTDIDTARLKALAGAGAAPTVVAPAPVGVAPAELQLTQLDAQIAQTAKTLGPNHPEMAALRANRRALAEEAAQERNAMVAQARAAAGAATASANAVTHAVQAARSRVVAESDKLGQLTQLQNEVNLRRDEFIKTSQKEADFREQAAVADAGLTPLADAVTPKAPAFPNVPLILAGALVLGFGVGVLVSLIIELFNRRVRGVEDLRAMIDAPLLAVIGGAAGKPPKRSARLRRVSAGASQAVHT